MKGMLKGYLLYLAGALMVGGYAWWTYTRQSGEPITGFLIRARASSNGHVPADRIPAEHE